MHMLVLEYHLHTKYVHVMIEDRLNNIIQVIYTNLSS